MKQHSRYRTAGTCLYLLVMINCSCTDNRASVPALPVSRRSVQKKDDPVFRATEECDSVKWQYVYDAARLQVLQRCKVVTGVIAERNADEDGDEHMLLKLDKGQKELLLKKNYSKKEGNLVIEVVCVNTITRKRAKGACTGYVNNVLLPGVGDHVRVWGSYVMDAHNGWSEIHPVSKIEKMK